MGTYCHLGKWDIVSLNCGCMFDISFLSSIAGNVNLSSSRHVLGAGGQGKKGNVNLRTFSPEEVISCSTLDVHRSSQIDQSFVRSCMNQQGKWPACKHHRFYRCVLKVNQHWWYKCVKYQLGIITQKSVKSNRVWSGKWYKNDFSLCGVLF